MITYFYKYYARDPKTQRTVTEEEWEELRKTLEKDCDRRLVLYAIAVNSDGDLMYCKGDPIVTEALRKLAALMQQKG